MDNELIEKIYTISEKLYQSDGDKEINNIINIIEEITAIVANKIISNENIEYFNVLVSNILVTTQMKDWIFASDILRYELADFIQEVI